MRFAFLAVFLLIASGCNQERKQTTHQDRQQTERTHYAGTFSIPVPTTAADGSVTLTSFAVPVDVLVERTLTEGATSQSATHSETTAPPWVGQLLSTLGQRAIGTAVSVAAGRWGTGEVAGLVTAGATALAGAAGWASQRQRANAEAKRANEHKADADEAWNKLVLARGVSS